MYVAEVNVFVIYRGFTDYCALHTFDDKGTTGFTIKPDYSWFQRLTLEGWNESPKLLVSIPNLFDVVERN